MQKAFRKIPLSDALFSGIAAGDKSIKVQVMEDDSFLKSKYAEAIRSLLLDRGLKVRFTPEPGSNAPAQAPDYLFICRVDYAGVTALPDAPGSGTFRRRAAVLFPFSHQPSLLLSPHSFTDSQINKKDLSTRRFPADKSRHFKQGQKSPISGC